MVKERNSNLDIVRTFSAFLVLSIHVGQYAGFDFSVGAKGVQLFFILSGYLAYASLEKDNTKKYYIKRACRILPTYWFCLILLYVTDLLTGKAQCGVGFLRYVFMVHMISPSDDWNLWNNYNALWTMSAFAVFYIVAPVLHKLIDKFYKALIVLIIFLYSRNVMVSYMYTLLIDKYPEEAHIEYFIEMNPLSVFHCFLLGIALFLAIKEMKTTLAALLISGILVVTGFGWYPYELFFTLLILIAVQLPAAVKNRKINNIIMYISQGSFCLYLIHPLVLRELPVWLWKLNISVSGIGYTFLLYLACIAASYLLYYGIIQKIEVKIAQKIKHE